MKFLPFVLLVSASASFAWSESPVLLEYTGLVPVTVDRAVLPLSVAYPGETISGICGVEIRADSYGRGQPIQNFFDAIEIGTDLGDPVFPAVKNDKTILIDLKPSPLQPYGVWFSVKTKSGRTLKQEIERTLGSNRTVVLVPVGC